MKTYRVKEIFFSLQGEGVRAGTANVFVRFAGCNLKCDFERSAISPGGWQCDTDFEHGHHLTESEIVREALRLLPPDVNPASPPKTLGVIFTGGEPALQLDVPLLVAFHTRGFFTAIETNGTRALSDLLWLDWITLSPKVPEHELRQLTADELKYVVTATSDIPRPAARATFRCVSPAFAPDGSLPRKNLDRAMEIVRTDPRWRLSVQQHKQWGVR